MNIVGGIFLGYGMFTPYWFVGVFGLISVLVSFIFVRPVIVNYDIV